MRRKKEKKRKKERATNCVAHVRFSNDKEGKNKYCIQTCGERCIKGLSYQTIPNLIQKAREGVKNRQDFLNNFNREFSQI